MPAHDFPIDSVRARFPALALEDEGRPRIYFDNPAGTQVPVQVLAAHAGHSGRASNANLGGYFASSLAAGAVVEEAHAAMADFYNAASARDDRVRPEHDDAHLSYLALSRAKAEGGR